MEEGKGAGGRNIAPPSPNPSHPNQHLHHHANLMVSETHHQPLPLPLSVPLCGAEGLKLSVGVEKVIVSGLGDWGATQYVCR